MSADYRFTSGRKVTDLIVGVFRLNGRLLAAGDRLVADLGLTSARWQILGAIAHSPTAETVARLARNMGLYRQGVQRIVNDLVSEDFVEFRKNLHHRRAKLVVLTKKGRAAFEAVDRRQKPWADSLSKGLKARDIASAARIIETLRARLEKELGWGAVHTGTI
jgi:DNA-binding MarR family transcriptional regulator